MAVIVTAKGSARKPIGKKDEGKKEANMAVIVTAKGSARKPIGKKDEGKKEAKEKK